MRKILILNNDLELGGIQKSLIEFLNYLVSTNEFSIDLMLWQENGPLQKQLPVKVNTIFQKYPATANDILNAETVRQKITLCFLLIKSLYCRKILGKPWMYYRKVHTYYDFAISFSHNGLPRFFTIDRVSAKQKYLWYHHGSYEHSKVEKHLDQRYYQNFDKIIAVSTANKEMLTSVFGDLRRPLVIVPNIINSSEIVLKANEIVSDIPQKKSKEHIFVTVSRFSKEKGLNLAIEVASLLRQKGLVFTWYFVGDGDQYDQIKQLAKDKRVADVCLFLGSKENPYPYIKIADLYIQSSLVEAHPLTITEALALRKIIVSTDIPSIREILQEGKLGVLCKPKPEIFAAEILDLLDNIIKQKELINTLVKYNFTNDDAYKAINCLLNIGVTQN